MPTKKFQIYLVDGHAIIEENENIILIDTGSPSTIHSQHTLNFMGSAYPVSQNYGSVTIPVLCDLVGTRITTLIGMDILRKYSIIFDYPNKHITFSNDNNIEFQAENLPLRIMHGVPVINATINQSTIPCFFDSGAKLSYLKAVETHNLNRLIETEDFYPGVGRFNTATFEIETRVGNRTFPVIYGNLPRNVENQLLTLVDGNNGILGYDFLSKFKIYLNASLNDLRITD